MTPTPSTAIAAANANGTPSTPSRLRIGVLAIQGGFAEHVSHLKLAVGHLHSLPAPEIEILEVRTAEDMVDLVGLVIPGGESTTLRKVLEGAGEGLLDAVREFVHEKRRPVLGTCAGLVMLANEVEGEKPMIGGLDVHVVRNFYGAQPQSFEADVQVTKPELRTECRMVFIRAPRIVRLLEPVQGTPAEPLATHGGIIVAVKQGNVLATAFHPELTAETSWHSYFLKMIIKC